MVLFDKGGYLSKAPNFHKEKKEWLYQLKHATEFSDRADATSPSAKSKMTTKSSPLSPPP